MASLDSRLVLWRNTIQLFHETKSLGFVGPFKKAGFIEYRVEPILKTPDGDDGEPDIVSWTDRGEWVALELTLNPESKCEKLEKYLLLDPRYLENIGVLNVSSQPDVLCARIDEADDGHFCQIMVKDALKIRHEETITNRTLAAELKNAENSDLRRLPSIGISLLPESKGGELRRGIVEQIQQLFCPGSEGATAEEIVDVALEKLAPVVRTERKARLVREVKNEMESLARRELSRYLQSDGEGRFKSKTPINMEHHATRLKIASILKEWAGTPSPQLTPPIESYVQSGSQ